MAPKRSPKQSPVELAFSSAIDTVEQRTGRQLFRVGTVPALDKMSPSSITADWLVEHVRHLLLSSASATITKKDSELLTRTAYDWPGGGTSLGNTLWAMLGQRSELNARQLKSGKYMPALGSLLGHGAG